MTILALSGNLTGTLNTTTGSPTLQSVYIGENEINYSQLNVGSQRLIGNPTLTAGSAEEIPLGSSLYFKANGTLAIVGLTNDIIVGPDGTTARFFGNTYSINPSIDVDIDNWAPVGLGSAGVIKFEASQYIDITGIEATKDGQQLVLQNIGTMPVRLVNLGTASTVNQFNFTRNVFLDPNQALTILYDGTSDNWRLTNKIDNADSEYFGTGFDGDVTISSGTTLTRDMYYKNLTITAGPIYTNGWKIFVSEVLDLKNAPSNAIQFCNPASLSGNLVTGTYNYVAGNSVGAGGPGLSTGNSGNMSSGGNGGLGGGCSSNQLQPFLVYKFADGIFLNIQGGCGGAESIKGPSGSGGGIIFISARYIDRRTSAGSPIIISSGGSGINGGGGGWIYIAYNLLLGTTPVTNALSAPGGSGSNGGLPGMGGRITLIDLTANTVNETVGSSQTCLANL
jgi:hypothetical protein